MSMGNRPFFPHITNFQFELCQKINTLCCQLGSCHRACPRSLRRLSRFHLARSSTLARALRAALASRVGVCWLLRGSRPSDEAPGSQHPCDCRAPRPRHNIDPKEREREPVRLSSPGSQGSILCCCCCHLSPQPLPIVRCQ